MHNLEPQFVPSMGICRVQVFVHSWYRCSFHGTFKYCYFLNKCSPLKWPKNSRFWEFNDKKECKLKLATRATFCNFFHWNWSCGSEVMIFWMRHLTFCQNTHLHVHSKIGYHCDLRKNTQFKMFLAESVSIQTKRASVDTIKDLIFCFWAV